MERRTPQLYLLLRDRIRPMPPCRDMAKETNLQSKPWHFGWVKSLFEHHAPLPTSPSRGFPPSHTPRSKQRGETSRSRPKKPLVWLQGNVCLGYKKMRGTKRNPFFQELCARVGVFPLQESASPDPLKAKHVMALLQLPPAGAERSRSQTLADFSQFPPREESRTPKRQLLHWLPHF